MENAIRDLMISTPGRVCLFGEHQDYLHLPVIPCAISLRLSIEGQRRNDTLVSLDLPDIRSKESFSLSDGLEYTKDSDYFRSVIQVLKRHGFSFSHGLDCVVHSNIPISAGTSSSSALVVSWVNFLANMSSQQKQLPPERLARYAYEAEVLEFGEPGGMMDQCSCAYGGIVAIDFLPLLKIEPLDVERLPFVLGDSCQPKDTKSILARVKNQVLDIAKRLSAAHPRFSLHDASVEEVDQFRNELTVDQYGLLVATLRNRDITGEARTLFNQSPLNRRQLGDLLCTHQNILRDALKISTPKIDRMLDAAMGAGAYGGKINGSGGGGCMFVYAPERQHEVAEAIESAGGRAFIVSMDEGTRIDNMKTAG